MSRERSSKRVKIEETEDKSKEPGLQSDVSDPKSKDYQTEAGNSQLSCPPQAWHTNPKPESWDSKDLSTNAEVSQLFQRRMPILRKHPLLWHIENTLEDPDFWKLQFVRQTNGATNLGYSTRTGNIKRLITWVDTSREGEVSVIDCTRSMLQFIYRFNVTDHEGSITVCTPSNGVVFEKSISSTPLPSTNKPKIEPNWDLPTDTFSHALVKLVKDSVHQVEGPPLTTDPLGLDLVETVKGSMRQVEGPPFPDKGPIAWLLEWD